jgi:integrase/recombinase XerC/integrase/recombinase XerD
MKTKAVTNTSSKTLLELIAYFELCNNSENKSPKTVSWYTGILSLFYNYVKERHPSLIMGDIDIQLLREYVLYLQQRPKTRAGQKIGGRLSPVTVGCHVRALRAFFNWLYRENLSPTNLAANFKVPKAPSSLIMVLSDDEIKRILAVLDPAIGEGYRDSVIFMILLDTGLRLSELAGLKLEDINMEQGLLKVMGKGAKERIVPMGVQSRRVLQRYIFQYRPKPLIPDDNHVFISSHGFPITANSIKLVFSRISRRANVPRLHAHLCRHTFATRYVSSGGNIFALQLILGHSSLEMVKRYVSLSSSNIAIQHQKYSPLDCFEATRHTSTSRLLRLSNVK